VSLEDRPVGREDLRRTVVGVLLIGLARVALFLVVGLMLGAAVPVLIGWRSGVILTGSMAPVLRVGDIVVTEPVTRMPGPGSVVALHDPARSGEILVHRLDRIDSNGDFITKGDANASADSTPVAPGRLLGVARYRVPFLGLIAVWARRRDYVRLLVTGFALIALSWLATGGFAVPRRRVVGPRRRPPFAPEFPSHLDSLDSLVFPPPPLFPAQRQPGREPPIPARHARHLRSRRGAKVSALAVGATFLLLATAVPLGHRLTFAVSAFTASTVNPGNSVAAAVTFPTYPQAVIADNPLVYYRGDDADGSLTAADSSGNGTTGSYVGTVPAFQVPGGPGVGLSADTAMRFSGASLVSASSTATLVNQDTFTEEIWFTTTTTAGGRLLGMGSSNSGNSGTSDRYISMAANGSLSLLVGATTITSPATGYNDGSWHQAAASLGAAGMRLYVDGALVANNAGVTTGTNYTGRWRIGGDTAYFAGTLDEAAVFLTQLADAQVTAHHTSGTTAGTLAAYTAVIAADTPWALWHLNDPAKPWYTTNNFVTPMADSSGSGHAGVVHNLWPHSVVGGGGGALIGVEASSPSIGFGPGGGVYDPVAVVNPTVFSLELWFRTTSTTGGELIGFGDQQYLSSFQRDRIVYMRDDGLLTYGIYDNGTTVVTLSTSTAYNDGVWHHLVATFGPAGMIFYLDGVQVGINASPGVPQVATDYWRWGGDNVNGWPVKPTSEYFNGDLDEMAVYSTQLTPARILRHLHANH
jgi:signal peptidase I